MRLSRRKLIFGAISILFLAYAGSYLALSLRGRYEPAVIGLNGVKWYHWAPNGFVNEFRWHQGVMLVYYPLYILDIRVWHTSDKAL
jgi:hypothetical protein